MNKKQKKYNYLYTLIGLILVGLIGIQAYWINNSIRFQRNVLNESLQADFETIAHDIEEGAYCFKLYSKSLIKVGEGIQLLKYHFDLDTKEVLSVDTVNMYNFFVRENDTSFQNYNSINLTTFSATLDATFSFAFEGIRDSGAYNFTQLTPENLNVAYDNTFSLATIIDTTRLDKDIKAVLEKNELDTQYIAGMRKSTKSEYDFVLGSMDNKKLMDEGRLEVPLLSNGISSPYLLTVYVPDSFGVVLKSSFVMMLSSAIVILILILSFAYFVRTIINQEKLSVMKDNFISNITHEFKTPLTNINLAIENWRESKSKGDHYFDIVGEESKKLDDNVEQILQLASLEHHNVHLDFKPVDMHEVIVSAVSAFDIQLQNLGGSIKLNLNAEHYTIKADERQMLNMLHNLIDNAIKYRDNQPEIVISTSNVSGKLILTVKDNGIGMSAEVLKNAFDRFYRHTIGDRHDVKGFGLGLSYVKHIVDYHRGEIDVKSKPEKGTEFIIYLPLKS
ncbi:MAG: HAMP domain-containing histidine kinase [Chitinophagaceae bacterium]|nr:HAMP domain-containing histidine kinase [Chitinophagaceae bacterium]